MNNIDYIVVGLGNIGNEYNRTRHNVGFMALDFVMQKIGSKFNSSKFKASYAFCKLSNKKVLFLKPETYMNLSGQVVLSAMSFYKIKPEKVILIFDDISLPVGKFRIRKNGSHGGHNGVKNIINWCGSNSFPRIKIGVGNKPNEHWDLANWVLSKFGIDETNTINENMDKVYEALCLIVTDQIDESMNKFN